MISFQKIPGRLTACLFVILSGISPVFASEDRPNILWISAEDTTLEYGCYGDAYATTPNIDQFAKEGILYQNCFAESPMCAPSRFTLITGLHNGPLGTSPMRSAHRIPDDIKGFPTYLREAGYYCTNNRKTDYNTSAQNRIIKESWDDTGLKAHWKNRKPGQPFFAIFNYEKTHQSWDSQLPYQNFKEGVQDHLPPEQIHDPDSAPLPPYYPETPTARKTIARYYDCITSLDHFVKEKLNELEEQGVAEDTIVVFFADNGGGIPRAKATSFESGVREPLIVRVPEKYRKLTSVKPGSVEDRLVCFADFAPTMLNLAGVRITDFIHGKPFLGPDSNERRKSVIGTRDRLDETLEVTRWLTDGKFHYIRSYRTHVPFDQQTLIGFYNGGAEIKQTPQGRVWVPMKGGGELCWEIRALKKAGKLNALQKQYWGDSRPAEALYDCRKDPWNLNNLAEDPEYQDRLSAMREELHNWILQNRDLGFWPEPEIAEVEKTRVPIEFARDQSVFPLERILSTAELSAGGPETVSELQRRLQDENRIVRYWSVVGLHSLKAQTPSVLNDLTSAMNDSSDTVRVEAARAMADLGESGMQQAMELLIRELDNPNEWIACRAAHALMMLGEKSRPYLETIQQASVKKTQGRNYAFQHSLLRALQELEGE